MDLKYILCEPISKLAVKATEQATLIQSQPEQSFDFYWSNSPSKEYTSSPKSVCSSLSTCSSTSSNSSSSQDELMTTPGRSHSFSSIPQQVESPSRRRTASDVSLTRHHMFIYSHPHRRPRSESAGHPIHSVQTRTPWTPFEDHLLRQGYDQGLSWAMISSTYLPHRSRGCCWGRFKTLQNKNMVDPTHTHMRQFRRPWKAIDFNQDKKH
jgi:hypothetical protein